MNPADMTAALQTVAGRPRPETLATGSYGLNLALEGGWPKGHVSELYGPPMSGKSVLAYATMARAPSGMILLVDYDGSYRPQKGAAFGIDQNRLLVTGNPATVTDYFAHGHLTAELVVFDGIPHQDEAARVERILADVPCTALCVTQERERLERRKGRWVSLGSTGGWLSEPSARVRLAPSPGGFREAEVQRNSFAGPADPVYFMLGPTGIDSARELLDLGLLHGLIEELPGKRYWLVGEPLNYYLGHGELQAAHELGKYPELGQRIWELVLDDTGLPC